MTEKITIKPDPKPIKQEPLKMTDKEKIHSKWLTKIMRVLAEAGLKDLSFSDEGAIRFYRDGYKMDLFLKLTKDNNKRMIG